MENIVNITDKLEIRNLKYKISRLEGELDARINVASKLRDENTELFRQKTLLKEENEELKRLLKELQTGITYG